MFPDPDIFRDSIPDPTKNADPDPAPKSLPTPVKISRGQTPVADMVLLLDGVSSSESDEHMCSGIGNIIC